MKCASIHQTTRNLTIVLAGLLCVIVLTAQAVIAGQQEPRQKPKTDSNVDPLGILNTPEPPKPNPPAGQTPASNKPTQTSGQPTQRPAVMSSSLDSLFSPKSISVAIYHPVSRNFLQGGGRDWGTGVFQPSALFNLIDLNGGQLESGDFVNLVHQQTGQSLLITQGEKDRGLALGPKSSDESAKFKILKLETPRDQGFEIKGVIKAEDPIALQTSDGQTLKITGMIKRPKIEATSKFEKETIFQIHIAENESQALAAAQESANQRAAEQYEKQKAREARNNAILNGIEQMKIDARNEQIQQAQEAQRIKAEQEAAREEAAKQAEAQRQLDEFRNAEAEAKRQRDEQAAQEAERQRQAALAVPPQLLSPAPNAVMNNGCYNNSAYVTRTYSWTAVPSATLYQLFVKHPNGRAPNLDVQVSDTTYKERSNSYAPESSRFGITWKVRAMINGQWGAWSEERAFNYEQVNTNPACRQ